MPLLGQLRVIRWFWRLCPLAQRIPGFLYMIDIPFWCYIERTCLMILCCLVTVQIIGLKTGFIFCSASFSKSNVFENWGCNFIPLWSHTAIQKAALFQLQDWSMADKSVFTKVSSQPHEVPADNCSFSLCSGWYKCLCRNNTASASGVFPVSCLEMHVH